MSEIYEPDEKIRRIAELESALRDYEIAGGKYDATRRRVTDLEAENKRIGNTLHAEEIKNYVLEAEIERLLPDAERYRKAKRHPDFELTQNFGISWEPLAMSEWDTSIDAAMEGE